MSESSQTAVPLNLKAERLNRGLTIEVAAAKARVPESTLRRAERGLGVRPMHAKRIADFYGVLVTDIWQVEAAA